VSDAAQITVGLLVGALLGLVVCYLVDELLYRRWRRK
jgi:ABC-type nitrate/sulfonate/bicarbonate transport system permease component